MSFPDAARAALADSQLRRNLGHATRTIREKRAGVVAELPDWEELRHAGRAIKDGALGRLDQHLTKLEERVVAAGGAVHWARDGAEANRIVADVVRAHGAREVVKVKSIATDEIRLNEALADEGIAAVETDLAELIIQLGDDAQSHILVPAIHRNRAEIRALFRRELGLRELTDEPSELAEAARRHLRRKFLEARVGVSGANFAVAETGSVCVVESEGNGRMCTTLPEVLVTVMGIEKLLPAWRDLGVFLQLLPRSSTGERMNPYTSLWTGVRQGDGPAHFHLVLLDNGRTDVLRDEVGRQALRCIRCSACLNVCPVYSRVGGHAYESVYPGPIGAILTPQLKRLEGSTSLPWASSLCGACYEVCPVEIDIPRVLVHLRGRVVERRPPQPEALAMRGLFRVFSTRKRYEVAQRLARLGRSPLARLPGPLSGWTATRDLPQVPRQSFRDWWRASGRPTKRAAEPLRAEPLPGPRPSERLSPDGADARSTVVRHVREAIAGAQPPEEPPREYRTASDEDRATVVGRFAERAAEYRAEVIRVEDVADAVGEACRRRGARRLGVAAGVPAEWRPEGLGLVEEGGLSTRELDGLDGALTGCAIAIAETGTIVLDSGECSGRRALTLVPDLHLCVVEEDQIAGLVPEAIERLAPAVQDGRPLTLVSGPSATSDIELSRVEGVHGPRDLVVLVAAAPVRRA
jgi:iron-sulfur cluster protein